jgi:hypothetical protein
VGRTGLTSIRGERGKGKREASPQRKEGEGARPWQSLRRRPAGGRRGRVRLRRSRACHARGNTPPGGLLGSQAPNDSMMASGYDGLAGGAWMLTLGGGTPTAAWRRGHDALGARARSRAPGRCFNFVYPTLTEPNSKNSNRSSISPKTRLVEEL